MIEIVVLKPRIFGHERVNVLNAYLGIKHIKHNSYNYVINVLNAYWGIKQIDR
jgi:hypothetical protein